MTEKRALSLVEKWKAEYTDREALKMKLLTYAFKYSYTGTRSISNIFYKASEEV